MNGGIHLLLPYAAGHLGYALALSGQPQQGAALLRDVIAQSKMRRFVAYLSRWTSMLGEAELLSGDVAAAARSAAEALALATRYGEAGNRAAAEALVAAISAETAAR